MRSIRRTLCSSIVGGLLLLTIVAGTAGFLWARHLVTSQVDSILEAKARALANLVEEEDGIVHFEFSDDNMPEFLSAHSDHFFQVWRPDGTVLARSKSLAGADLPDIQGTPENPGVSPFQLDGNRSVRVVGFQFVPIQEVDDKRFYGPSKIGRASIVVSRDTRELDSLIVRLFWIIVSCAVLLPLFSAVIVRVAVKNGLRPLDALAVKVGEIDASSLETRISEGKHIFELQPITTKLNDLLARLHAAFERERRFTMDASHELRTPLAESRTALEIALKWPDDRQLLINSATQALEATYQMEGLVAALLAFARAESDKIEGPREKVHLPEVVQHCWHQFAEVAAQKNMKLASMRVDDEPVQTNKALATAIINNLLANAVRYAPADSEVDYAIVKPPKREVITLRFSNEMDTPLTPDDLDHLFEPLWRKDKSRTEETGTPGVHFGLGLTLVRAYCEKLEIQVGTDLSGNRFNITLEFPKN